MYKTRLIILTIVFGGIVGAALIGIYVFRYLDSESKATAESKPLKLYLPKDSSGEEVYKYGKDSARVIINVLLYGEEGIYAYEDEGLRAGRRFEYQGFRSYLKEMIQPDSSIVVIIKPGITSTYRNTVNILDEMAISNIRKYAMVDINKTEAKFIDSLLK